MSVEEIRVLLARAKFCIRRQLVIGLPWGEYIPTALVLRCVKGEWNYSVEFRDKNCTKSTITIDLDKVEWPSAGGGFICRE